MKAVDIFINIMGMCLVTFVVPPIIEQLAIKIPYNMTFNQNYYRDRIDSIVMIVCGGILVQDAHK